MSINKQNKPMQKKMGCYESLTLLTSILYILDKNDPLLNYEARDSMLRKSINMGHNIKILIHSYVG